MTGAPEFPQADPAIQYIARQCSKIEEQYACNAGYHKDHKAIKQRLDNLDNIISSLKNTVIAIQDFQQNANNNLHKIQDLNSHLDSAVEAANNKILKKFDGEQQIRLNELRDATWKANDTLREFNQNTVTIYNRYDEINRRLKSEIRDEASRVISDAWQKNMVEYILVTIVFCIMSMLIGKFIL